MIQQRRWLLGPILLALLLLPTLAPADVLHVYDRLYRLRATVDTTANDSSIWVYDAVGNILAITRQPARTTILELPADAIAGPAGSACSASVSVRRPARTR